MRVSVIGGSTVSREEYDRAREVGRLLGERGHDVVCGGLTGVMEAVCRGASAAGGRTIGILPGENRRVANEYVDVAVATGMGSARNALVVLNGDAAIAIDGSTGTLSEIGLALDYGRPVAGLDTHDVAGVEAVETPEAAVAYVDRRVGGGLTGRRGPERSSVARFLSVRDGPSNVEFTVVQGDIATQRADVLVNAAGTSFRTGSGVAGALRRDAPSGRRWPDQRSGDVEGPGRPRRDRGHGGPRAGRGVGDPRGGDAPLRRRGATEESIRSAAQNSLARGEGGVPMTKDN